MTDTVLSRSNPFPSYPVMKLADRSTDIVRYTGETDQVARVRDVVKRYAATWGLSSRFENKEKSLFIPVQGDYGSGKTHLVKYATSLLAQELEPLGSTPRSVAVATTEVDCWSWYRSVLGPALMQQIEPAALLTRVLAKAAIEAARRAPLTDGFVSDLEADPALVFKLLAADRLNVSEVQERFERIVETLCADAGGSVTRAFIALTSLGNRERAIRFLSGATMGKVDLEPLRIDDPLDSEDDGTRVIVGLAAICSYLRSPFVMVIDEFEHLARYDALRSSRNVTWVKRLLESLADHGPFVMVSGHWSAWKQKIDFGDRFTNMEVIRLLNVDRNDVLKIVERRLPGPRKFGDAQAQTVVSMTAGRMRQVMTLLAAAYRESEGFQRELSTEELQRISDDLGQRMTLDTAEIEIHAIFERMRLTVSRDPEKTAGIPFTMSGLLGERPCVVAKLRHATSESDYIEQVHEFREQVQSLREKVHDVVGILLADGNVDRDYIRHLRYDANDGLLYYELQTANVLDSIEADLQRELAPSSRRIPIVSVTGVELDAIERRRKEEQQETSRRIGTQWNGSARDMAVTAVGVDDSKRRFDTYRELSERPGLFRRISLLPISTLAIAGSAVALLILASVVSTDEIAQLFGAGRGVFVGLVTIRYTVLMITPILIAFVLWRSFSRIDRFSAFSTRVLRELYVKEAPEEQLVRASNILQNALDFHGPNAALNVANEQLRKTFKGLETV